MFDGRMGGRRREDGGRVQATEIEGQMGGLSGELVAW